MRRRWRRAARPLGLAARIVVALLAACGPTWAVEAPAPDAVYVEGLSCQDGRHGLRLPADARKLPGLGRLQREEVLAVERWDGYRATRKRLQFDGLELEVVVFSNDPARWMLAAATVTTPAWDALLPQPMGTPAAALQAWLGQPANSDPKLRRVYTGEADSLQLDTRDGRLARLRYSCYTG